MHDLSGELRDEVQLAKLARRSFFCTLREGVNERLVICLNYKVSTFENVFEECYGGEDGKKFTIVGAVASLCRAELAREESQWFSNTVFELFKCGAYGGI